METNSICLHRIRLFLKARTKFKNSHTLIIKEKVAFENFDVGCELTRYIFIFLMFSENDHTNQRKSINKWSTM